ncbi:MAG: ABC transporter permease [Clostridiales Family XIII bacterium]|jgi:peptide/nickel transport system permease protein|nr:ABC transporter permease [Clostridiales Family XIII bacterium]
MNRIVDNLLSSILPRRKNEPMPELPRREAPLLDFELSEEDTFFGSHVVSYGVMILKRFIRHRLALIGFAVLLIMVLAAIFTPVICRYSPTDININLLVNGLPAPPSAEHWFGTDNLGRDYFARICYGMRVSLLVGFGSTFIAFIIGIPIGCIAGYYGGKIDWIISRGMELVGAVPSLFLMIFFSAITGGGVIGTIFVIGLTSWTGHVRGVRAYFFSLKDQDFAQAAVSLGMSTPRIMFKHILPFSLAPEIVSVSGRIASNLTMETGMSFLGFGVQEPTPSWGAMLNNAREFIVTAPLLVLIPAALIALVSLSCNFIGDGLRDAFDPKTRV